VLGRDAGDKVLRYKGADSACRDEFIGNDVCTRQANGQRKSEVLDQVILFPLYKRVQARGTQAAVVDARISGIQTRQAPIVRRIRGPGYTPETLRLPDDSADRGRVQSWSE